MFNFTSPLEIYKRLWCTYTVLLIGIIGSIHCISCSPTNAYEELSFRDSYYFTPLVSHQNLEPFLNCRIHVNEVLRKQEHSIKFTEEITQDELTYLMGYTYAQWYGDLTLSIVNCPIDDPHHSSLIDILQRLTQTFDLNN